MDINNIKTYLAIAIVGTMVGVLYAVIQKEYEKTLTILFITLYVVVLLRYFLERRHYKKHKSILASSQFLILPYCIMLMGNYISPIAFTWEIFDGKIDFSGGGSIQFPFNLISISLFFPLIVLSVYFSNYYAGKWPAIAINRKINKGRKIPFLIHTLFVTFLLIGFFINWIIDLVSFIFVVFYIIYIFRYFVIVRLVKEKRQVATSTASSRSTSRTSSQRSSSASRARSASTTRSGTRTVPTRSRKPQASRASSKPSARVAPGIDVRTTRKTKTKSQPASKNLFPIGTPKKEEMKCIICYMDFNKKEKRRIILCPNCKYPAHEDEFLSWFQKSKLCARCNQSISTSYVRNPKYRITIKIYIEKVIEKL